MHRDLELLKTDYEHPDEASLINALEQFLAIYANRSNWRASRGEPPHFLRRNEMLDFHPSNVTHGYHFAEEALEVIRVFRETRRN